MKKKDPLFSQIEYLKEFFTELGDLDASKACLRMFDELDEVRKYCIDLAGHYQTCANLYLHGEKYTNETKDKIDDFTRICMQIDEHLDKLNDEKERFSNSIEMLLGCCEQNKQIKDEANTTIPNIIPFVRKKS